MKMNDRYLFRGKRVDNGEWVIGMLTKMWEQMHIITPDNENTAYAIIPETVGQCTGLKGKNGKLIFEGDIVEMPAYQGGKHKSLVYFKNGKFAVDGSNYGFKDIAPRNMKIIGNYHDNPELLEAEE